MPKKYTFSVIGGDRRQVEIIKRLLLYGHYVKVFSLGTEISNIAGAEIFSSAEKALYESDVLILPLPITRDGVSVNLTAPSDKILLNEVFRLCSKIKAPIVFGGLVPEVTCRIAQETGIEINDYYKSEELQQKNALPSAEGAIMVAMENTDRVIEGMNVLVCGYGRIGKILARKLKLLGACVSVAARRDEVLCEIAMDGFTPIDLRSQDQLSKASKNSEVIFNTIPMQIFTRQIIDKIDSDPLYIEIASFPGGIDLQSARDRGMRIIFAPSLPGRYAPASAGEYIFETIKDILDKRGIKI